MVSPICLFMKLMICFVLLCTFIPHSHTQPLSNNDDDDQMQAYDEILNNHLPGWNRFNIPESFYDSHQQQLFHQNKPFHPDGLQLGKRIIMLPRVGRRSVRSTSE